MKLTIEPAQPWDVHFINIREQDLIEARAWIPGVSPQAALLGSVQTSAGAFTVADEAEEVVAMFGYSLTATSVHPWLMCSDLIEQYPKDLLRGARNVIETLLKEFPGRLMGNYVYRDNAQAKRLLKYLGFVVLPSPGTGKFDFFYHPKSCASPF